MQTVQLRENVTGSTKVTSFSMVNASNNLKLNMSNLFHVMVMVNVSLINQQFLTLNLHKFCD